MIEYTIVQGTPSEVANLCSELAEEGWVTNGPLLPYTPPESKPNLLFIQSMVLDIQPNL